LTREEAEALSLTALAFLASDGPRLVRFLQLTGLEPEALRAQAGEPETLIAVYDHLLGDQSLLLVFASEAGVAPEQIEDARRLLSGNNNPGVWL
jgi:hypothetical protein